MPRLVVIGSVNEDVTVYATRRPVPGESLMARAVRRTVGGKGVNQALAARWEGADVTFVGAVGDDHAGESARATLRNATVDIESLATEASEPTGLAVITVTDDAENTILVVPGANHSVSAESVSARVSELAAQGNVVLLTQGELAPAVLSGLAETVAETAAPWILNLAPFIPLPVNVLRRVSVLVVNETELSALADFVEVGPSNPLERAQTIAEELAVSIVVTLGSEGALVVERGQAVRVPAEAVSNAVDTTGAGDAFVGALAAGLVAGEALTAAARRGCRLGAVAVGREGAALVPSAVLTPTPTIRSE